MSQNNLLYLLLIILLISSCQKDEIPPTTELVQETDFSFVDSLHKPTVLGKKLENPYSVENMKIAYKSLVGSGHISQTTINSETDNQEDSFIETTDYYVRFWVENDDQRDKLIADSLNLSETPLDVEVEHEGVYYVDEETEIEEGKWFYTSVIKEYEFYTDIEHEILEELFLIEESDEDETNDGLVAQPARPSTFGRNRVNDVFLEQLEDESFRLTGNLDEEHSKSSQPITPFFWKRKSKKTPLGYVKVYNTVTRQLEPVVGIKVKTRRWFKWAKGWTNSQGYYKVNRGYRNNVRYTAVFKNTIGFKIWPSTISISSARYRAGSHSKSGYDFNFLHQFCRLALGNRKQRHGKILEVL